MDSTERNIAIIGIIALIAIGLYSYSPNLQPFAFVPPPEIEPNHENYFNFIVHNYGEKSGSYKLDASSEDFLIKIDSSIDSEYKHDFLINTYIDNGDDNKNTWKVNIKANESNLSPNASVKFSYLDTSLPIYTEKYTWNLFYELDESQKYQKYYFINQTFRKSIVLVNMEILI